MELVLDGPMGAADLRQASWREHLRQSDVADGCLYLWFAIAGSSLRLDPADRLEAWESGARWETDRLSGPMSAAIRCGHAPCSLVSEEGEIASSGEAFLGGRMEQSSVSLEDQRHIARSWRRAPPWPSQDDNAGRQPSPCSPSSSNPSRRARVAFTLGTAGSAGIGYRQPRLAVPHAHHERRHMRLPLLVSAAKSFAVDRHNSLRRWQAKRAAHCRHERCRSPRQLRRIEQPEEAAESIVARHAIARVERSRANPPAALRRTRRSAPNPSPHTVLPPAQQTTSPPIHQSSDRAGRVCLAQNRHHRHWAPSAYRGLLQNPSVHLPR